jgi:hypothetical protein
LRRKAREGGGAGRWSTSVGDLQEENGDEGGLREKGTNRFFLMHGIAVNFFTTLEFKIAIATFVKHLFFYFMM